MLGDQGRQDFAGVGLGVLNLAMLAGAGGGAPVENLDSGRRPSPPSPRRAGPPDGRPARASSPRSPPRASVARRWTERSTVRSFFPMAFAVSAANDILSLARPCFADAPATCCRVSRCLISWALPFPPRQGPRTFHSFSVNSERIRFSSISQSSASSLALLNAMASISRQPNRIAAS